MAVGHHPQGEQDADGRRMAIIQNSACRPSWWVTIGPSTMAMAKVTPKLTPIKAIALVRFCSRVRSDSRAITAAAMAPEPAGRGQE